RRRRVPPPNPTAAGQGRRTPPAADVSCSRLLGSRRLQRSQRHQERGETQGTADVVKTTPPLQYLGHLWRFGRERGLEAPAVDGRDPRERETNDCEEKQGNEKPGPPGPS